MFTIDDFGECKSKEINTLNGLSNGSVTRILKAKNGFLWVATQDGLNRLNGNEVRVFKHNTELEGSLPENQIVAMEEDDAGNLWLACPNTGILKFDIKTETFTPVFKPESKTQLITFQYYKNNLILVFSKEIKIYSVKGQAAPNPFFKKNILFSDSKTLSPIQSFEWDKSGDGIFLAFDKSIKHVQSLNGKTHFSTFTSGFSGSGSLLSVKESQRHLLFVFSENAMEIVDVKTGILIDKKFLPQGLLFGHQAKPVQDYLGNIWINSSDGQMFCLDSKTFALKILNGPWVRNVWAQSFFADKNGNLWNGTNGLGIQIFNLKSSHISKFSGQFRISWTNEKGNLQIPKSFAFPLDSSSSDLGRIPITMAFSKGKQSILVENGPQKSILVESRKSNEESVFDLYSGHGQKIKSIEAGHLGLKHGFAGKSLLFTGNGILWRQQALENGDQFLLKIDLTSEKLLASYRFPTHGKLPLKDFIKTSYLIHNRELWMGSSKGLFVFDTRKNAWIERGFQLHHSEKSIASTQINSILPDPLFPSELVWLGTENGLIQFEIKTKKIIKYTSKDGLANADVKSLLGDKSGRIWISGTNGISVLMARAGNFRNFTHEDGLLSKVYLLNESARSRNGKLYFGGIEGITGFFAEDMLPPLDTPKIVLTGLSVSNQETDWKQNPDIISKPIEQAGKITLEHTQNMFRIDFSLLDYAFSNRNEYQYMLVGYNQDWVPSGAVSFAMFSNVGPGSYLFKVRGRGESGIWNTNLAQIEIKVLAAWWQTWWFRLLVVVSLAGGLFGFYKYRLHQEKLLLQLREKLAIDLHDEVGSTLNSIAFFGETAKMMLPENDPIKPIMEKINSNSREVMDKMSDIVWSLNTKNETVENMVNRLKSFAISMLEPKGCLIRFQIDAAVHQIRLQVEQKQHLYLIAKEAINNASKYSACQNFLLSIQIQNKMLKLLISDDGNGFDEKIRGKGNGIINIKKRSELINAQFNMESELGKGTRITVILPLPNTYI